MNPASQNLQISVIIPNYNYAQFIGEAIESVLAQTVAPLEIIVGDDGSTDHSAAVVAQYADRVRYIQYPHSGETVVRTNLLHETRGEWVVMLDADDRLAPNYLEIMQEKIRAALPDDRLAFAYPDSECFGGRCGRIVRPEFDAQLLKKGNYIVVSSLVRADVARRFGFDSLFRAGQSDYDFFLTLASHGYRGLHVPEAILHYRIHSASITSDVLRKSRQRQIMRRLLRKHRHFFTRDEARTAMTTATQRYWASLIEARSPFAGLGRRTLDLMRFVRAGLNHAELFQQALYALAPAAYHRRRYPPADVFYLFRDTVERRRILAHLPAVDLNRTQLFGFAELQQSGWSMDCNLRLPRISSVRETVAGWIERWYAPRAGVGRGDVMAVRAHLWQMNRAKVVVATTDNTGMPAARLKASGRLKAKLVYISVGLPERMAAVRKISP
ncbi:MAG TPA: glycosyltransferase, partial [Kiritimatiellia bacterium]|nr:glycosyltransferase [Kiritimatiellia bacterium]